MNARAQEEHLDDPEDFGHYMNRILRMVDSLDSNVAYDLPQDYGYGFRGPSHKILGLWRADELSDQIWNDANALLEDHKLGLDIICEDCVGYN